MRVAVQDVDPESKNSMLVVSEFVGCSPSVSGAIRVNPWSIDSLADGIYTAIKMPAAERHLRHDKHWRYVSQHTVRFWAQVGPRTPRPWQHKCVLCHATSPGHTSWGVVCLWAQIRWPLPGASNVCDATWWQVALHCPSQCPLSRTQKLSIAG